MAESVATPEPTVRAIDPGDPSDLGHVRELFRAYAAEFAASIGRSLAAQGFEAELAGLPGRYAPPGGRLLLAMAGDEALGCVALRDLGGGACEMKRLYVRPAARGRGVGRRLVGAIVGEGRAAGYRRMVLDTLPEMADALALYRSCGFAEAARYWDNPIETTLYLERTLMADDRSPRPDRNVAAVQVDDGTMTNRELIDAYASGPDRLRAALAGMSAEQLRARPVAGRWSTLEVLCHLCDCEQFLADRIKRTIAMDRPLLLSAEGSRYPGPLHYHDREPEEELALIALTRAQMARILGWLDADTWTRTAVHSETGLVTLRQLVLHAHNHQEHHLKFVAEKRRALGIA